MTVSWHTPGTYATGTASCTPAYPLTPAAGDLFLLCVGWGNGDDTPPTVDSGFTLLTNSTWVGGTGSYGTDDGNRGVAVFYKISDGTEIGTVTVTNPGSGTTTRVTQAQMMRLSKTAAAWYVSATGGGDNTSGTDYSVTGAVALIPANGDIGVTVTAWRPDTATSGTPTLTWDGVGTTTTAVQSVASTQGADCRFVVVRRALAGTGGSAPVFATTAGAACAGATAFVLVHDGAAAAVEGQATVDFGFTGAASGTPRKLGVATASFGFTATAAGVDRALGLAVATFGFTGTGSGTPRVHGTAVASFGFTATASGIAGSPPVEGVATAAFGFTATAAGIDRALGVAVVSFGFTSTAAGVDRKLGGAVAAFGYAATANGIDRVLGQALATLGFAAVASGLTIVPTPTPAARTSVATGARASTAEADTRRSTATGVSRTSTGPPDVRASLALASSRTST